MTHAHGAAQPEADLPEETVALVGAPNVGKSVIFNALADAYVDVSNYPGTTVETTLAKADGYALTDTPGVYGISSFNEEERVTREIVLEADRVVNVVDATHLGRDLFLTLQLLDMGVPTVVALNMMDEAEADGIQIDVEGLESVLGVPVVPTVAVDREGIDDLRERLEEATAPEETAIHEFFDELPMDLDVSRRERTLLVEADEQTAAAVAGDERSVADGGVPNYVDQELREAVYSNRRERIRSILDQVEDTVERGRGWGELISDLMLHPLTGTPIALGVLGLIYFVIGDLVAQRLVDFLEGVLFGEYYNPLVRDVVGGFIPAADWADPIRFVLLNGNLGLLTVTVQYVLGVLLPLVIAFYLAIGTLEDSGVLPRLAVLTDRGLSRVGLNGRAIVPMIVGVGCVTMAVITTRMVGSRRERLIATGLLGLAIPCSAQLGVILGLLAGLGLMWWFGYLGILVLVLGVVGVALDQVLPGESQGLVAELPRMRVPRPANILRKTASRTKMFLREAIPLFAATAVAISVLDYAGILRAIERFLGPVTDLLGMPPDFAQVLILGIIRRDFAAAGMTDLAISPAQTFVGLVVITLFVPCILSMTMIAKERDATTGVIMWVGSWVVAFTVGAILAAVMGL
ncbi:MAG: ferrous iron transport protein B [Halodesulfurarchaeum sp.]